MSEKLSGDAPERAIEDRERHKKHKHSLLSEKETILNASQAPIGTYTQETYDGITGNRIKFKGPMIPLYITSDILDAVFMDFVDGNPDNAALKAKQIDVHGNIVPVADGDETDATMAHPSVMTEFNIRGGKITDDDKIHAMSGMAAGRALLAQYTSPSDIFIGTGAKPIMVKDYYVLKNGLAGRTKGLAPSLKTNVIATANSTVLARLAAALR